jgi:hypothetical protein
MSRFRGWSPLAGSLLDQARTLSREEFVRKHPDRYLLIPLVQPKDGTRVTTRLVRVDPKERARMDALPFDVVPVRKSAMNPASNLITIGRADTNDIVIGSSEVSKMHAFFMLDRTTNQVTLTDAGSTNGTKVDGRPLEPRVQAVPLEGGEALHIGTIKVTFHEAGTLWEFLRTFEPGR